jgi:hypothetical protein
MYEWLRVFCKADSRVLQIHGRKYTVIVVLQHVQWLSARTVR